MLKRTILAVVATCALAGATYAQENATIVTRSGDKITGQLLDHGGVGFTIRVDGKERRIPTNDVAVVDFTGSGNVSDDDFANLGSSHMIVLRNGEKVKGEFYDIGGTTPLNITVKTESGDRNFTSNEIGRIVLAQPSSAVATSGTTAASPGIPEGGGIAVRGNQAWTPTGITVRKGERLNFSATGELILSADANDKASAAGAMSQRKSASAPLPDNFAGALIARVGNSEPFPIGAQQTVTMPADGQLFLGINDDHVGDNQGGYRVTIQRQGRR